MRIETANTGSTSGNIVRELQTSKNGAAYHVVPTSGQDCHLVASSVWANNDATTALLTPVGSFQAGQGKSTANDTSSLSLTNGNYTEDQWSLVFTTAANGTYTFRVYDNSTGTAIPFQVYGVTPTFVPVVYTQSGQPLLWTASNWTNPTVYLESSFYTSNASFPAHMQLYDFTAGATVANSDISTTQTSSAANNYLLSSALTLTDGHWYVPYKGIGHGASINPQQRFVKISQ